MLQVSDFKAKMHKNSISAGGHCSLLLRAGRGKWERGKGEKGKWKGRGEVTESNGG